MVYGSKAWTLPKQAGNKIISFGERKKKKKKKIGKNIGKKLLKILGPIRSHGCG
jgi:hypothetical protein